MLVVDTDSEMNVSPFARSEAKLSKSENEQSRSLLNKGQDACKKFCENLGRRRVRTRLLALLGKLEARLQQNTVSEVFSIAGLNFTIRLLQH